MSGGTPLEFIPSAAWPPLPVKSTMFLGTVLAGSVCSEQREMIYNYGQKSQQQVSKRFMQGKLRDGRL